VKSVTPDVSRRNGWTSVRLKYLAHIEAGQSPPSETYSRDPNSGLPFLQGSAGFGARVPEATEYCSAPTKIAQRGAILMSVRAPVGEMNIADRPYGIGRGVCAIAPTKLHRDFLWWALHTTDQHLDQIATGTTYDAVSAEDIGNVRIVFPSYERQQVISTFLNKETAQIDALLDEKHQMLALLREKLSVITSKIVLNGVNAHRHMRRSGPPWLLETPADWELRRAKYLFHEIDDRSETGEEMLLSLRMEHGLVPHNDVSEKPIPAENLIGYKIARPNEIVLNRMRAASGLVAVAPQHGIVSPDYAVFRPLDGVDPEYFTLLFKTPLLQAVFRSLSRGLGTGQSGFLRLYSEDFLSIKLPVPRPEEQTAVVAELARERARTATVETALEDSRKLLKERRAALITAAVTGQFSPEEMSA